MAWSSRKNMSQTRGTCRQRAERSELDGTGRNPVAPVAPVMLGRGFHSRHGRSRTHGVMSLSSDWQRLCCRGGGSWAGRFWEWRVGGQRPRLSLFTSQRDLEELLTALRLVTPNSPHTHTLYTHAYSTPYAHVHTSYTHTCTHTLCTHNSIPIHTQGVHIHHKHIRILYTIGHTHPTYTYVIPYTHRVHTHLRTHTYLYTHRTHTPYAFITHPIHTHAYTHPYGCNITSVYNTGIHTNSGTTHNICVNNTQGHIQLHTIVSTMYTHVHMSSLNIQNIPHKYIYTQLYKCTCIYTT